MTQHIWQIEVITQEANQVTGTFTSLNDLQEAMNKTKRHIYDYTLTKEDRTELNKLGGCITYDVGKFKGILCMMVSNINVGFIH